MSDYLKWRQVDVHVNNLYNTTFWALVRKGEMKEAEAHEKLKGTLSADKNNILFEEFGINYDKEDKIYKRGSLVVRYSNKQKKKLEKEFLEEERKRMSDVLASGAFMKIYEEKRDQLFVIHEDVTKEKFWKEREIEKYY